MGSVTISIPRLEDYDISTELGFASSDVASPFVSKPAYKAWQEILSRLSVFLATKTLRQTVHSLPSFEVDCLKSDAERRYAYLALACLVQGYVFENAEVPTADVPPILSGPFLKICTYWGLQPVLSHIGFCLWNWRCKDDLLSDITHAPVEDAGHKRSFLLNSLDNVDSHVSFTSTGDEKAFSMVPLLVEAEGGIMIARLLEALVSASAGDLHKVMTTLEYCNERMIAMSTHLQTLHEKCDPEYFYHEVRPFIAGSSGMESKGLPEGFIFELADGHRVTSKCIGATAAQSSLFQFLDHMFGIGHSSTFLQEMRLYMPWKHRSFLQTVEKLPSLRQLIQAFPENKELQTALEQCIVHLQGWRTKHIGLATRYVVMPARRQASQEGVKGTGGSLPIPFLKETRNETV